LTVGDQRRDSTNNLMRGKTVLVTGSTDGIGRQTAIELARLGAAVIVHGRDRDRGRAALAAVRESAAAYGGPAAECELLLADLSTAAGARGLAAAVAARHRRLHVVINNAGVYSPRRETTEDGLELTFAVNVLAPFVLTRAVLPLLRAAAPARIVNLSSTSHWQGAMQWDDLQLERDYDPLVAYEQSKLAMTLLTFELARRLTGSGITAVCLDPGNVDTGMLRAGWPELQGVGHVTGAATSVYLASSPRVQGVTGVYYERGRETPPPAFSLDREAQSRLWAILERMAETASR
jgi:NAD(P)-dependent dehydrogenase (short-subunit alcohol dehydrogenase family)